MLTKKFYGVNFNIFTRMACGYQRKWNLHLKQNPTFSHRKYLIQWSLSSKAFGPNKFVSNDPFEALPHLQSNNPKFISNGNYSGHPGSNFKLSTDHWTFAAPRLPSLPSYHFQCCQIGLVDWAIFLCHPLLFFLIHYLQLFGLQILARVRFFL